jgi:hypothetical protein
MVRVTIFQRIVLLCPSMLEDKAGGDGSGAGGGGGGYVTPDFTRKTECISYVRQDQITHT